MSGEPRIKRHADGTRYVQLYLGTNPVTGKRVRPYHCLPDSMSDAEAMAEAKRWAAEMRAAYGLGTAMRLGDTLERYIEWIEAEGTAPNTVKAYRSIIRNRMLGLASVDPRKVTTAMVDSLYHELSRHGGTGGEPLSPNTVRQVHWFLRHAFDWMVRRGLVSANPVLSARAPKLGAHEAVALDEDDLGDVFVALANAIKGETSGPRDARRRAHLFAAWLALHTGLRCGECCAVRRKDVRQAQGIVCVNGTVIDVGSGAQRQGTTKGHRPRNVSVSARDMETIKAHLAWQDELLGGALRDRPLVSADGGYCRPKDVSATFSAFAREIGLPEGVSFHSLRHTHGTWLLMQGVPIKAVSERLGHADVATTLRVYAHVLPGLDQAAADGFSDLERGMGA